MMLAPAAPQRSVQEVARPDLVGRTFDARVVRIADGDTLEAVPVGETRPIRIRLHGVDAPELGETFSREAQTLLRTIVFDQRVRVEGIDMDRYGRVVARISIGGKDASTELVRAGLACHAYARNPVLASEEAQARTGGRGFWAATAKKPACVEQTAFSASTRRPGPTRPASPQTTSRVPAGYRGNVSAGVYHASTCPNANCRNCTRLFTTEAEAKAAGFRPAGDCLKGH
jgi:endonuclease YncB( thermonuclease family)